MKFYKGNEYTGDLSKLREVVQIVDLDGNFVRGHLRDAPSVVVELRVFAQGCSNGIHGGRISQLLLRYRNSPRNTRLALYDRGWETTPAHTAQSSVNKIIEALKE